MQKRLLLVHFLLLLLFTGGCQPEAATSLPTDMVTETASTEVTPSATSTIRSSETVTPLASASLQIEITSTPTPEPIQTSPTVRPSRTPTPTRTPKPIRAAIEILYPGPNSKVVSEVELRAYAQPGKDGRIRTQLIGEDGRTIFEQDPRYEIGSDVWGYIVVRIPFTLPLAGELCRLQVITKDEYGRLMAVNGIHILVLSGGYPEINAPARVDERFLIVRPKENDLISGNLMIVEGKIRPINDQPLIIELIDKEGGILASRTLTLPSMPAGEYIPFTTDLTYTVTARVPARLSLYQLDDRIPGILYLHSQEMTLKP